jgi:maltose alpha-D-glucosyltransferase/alpha-amylase
MQWDVSPNSGFSEAPADQLYLPQDPCEQRPLVSEQLAREDSLLNLVKKLLKLRQSVPCLGASGSLTQLNSPDQPYPAIFVREYDGQRALIAINPLASETCAEFSLKGKLAAPVLGEATVEAKAETKTAIHEKNIHITLPAFGFYVAELER